MPCSSPLELQLSLAHSEQRVQPKIQLKFSPENSHG